MWHYIGIKETSEDVISMKNVVLVGRPSADEEKFLTLMQSKPLLRANFIYQLKKIPGIGIRMRPLDPYVRETATTSEILDAAEEIITLQEKLDDDFQSILDEHEITTLDEYVPETEDKSKNTICFPYSEHYIHDVLKSVSTLRLFGYDFDLVSADTDFNRLMPLTACCSLTNTDFTLKLISSATDDETNDIDVVWREVLREVRKSIRLKSYARRLQERFRREDLGRNFFRLTKNEIYLTLSRKTRKLSARQNQFLHWLENGDSSDVPHVGRCDIEQVAFMLLNEHLQAERLDSLLPKNLVKIANMDDVILSFAGSRRCNLRCAYCFSNHSCATPSKMTPAQVVDVCDMLTYGRPNARIHFDNGLAGETMLDFDKVQMRHNVTLDWHKTTGHEASFGILTNGLELDLDLRKGTRKLKWLRTHVPYLGFSLDGDRKTNDRIRRDANGNSTYDRAVRGIRAVQRMNWPVDIGISSVITSYNTNIVELRKHALKLGVRPLVLKPVRAAQESDFALTYRNLPQLTAEYQKSFDYMMSAANAGNFEPLHGCLQPLDYAGRFLLRTFWQDRLIVKRCGSGEIIYSISDGGRVFPCDSFNGVKNRELGNLQEGMHNRTKYRVPFVVEEKFGCATCAYRYLCGGVCQYVQYLNGDGKECNDVIKQECELAKFLIKASLQFWNQARKNWPTERLEKLAAHIRHIGVEPFKNGSLVYAPC